MQNFTHLDADGNPSMVDVSEKKNNKTHRTGTRHRGLKRRNFEPF